MEEVGATHSRLRDERAALVVRAKRHAAVARDDREVQALDDGEAADDGAGEGAVADDLVRLLHVDAEEGRKEDGRAGNVALARAEGVADRGEGEEGLGDDDEDDRDGRRVVAVRAAGRGEEESVAVPSKQ